MCTHKSCKSVQQPVRKEQTNTGKWFPIEIVSDLTEVYIQATITNMKAEAGLQAPANYDWSSADPLEGNPKEEQKFARGEWARTAETQNIGSNSYSRRGGRTAATV